MSSLTQMKNERSHTVLMHVSFDGEWRTRPIM